MLYSEVVWRVIMRQKFNEYCEIISGFAFKSKDLLSEGDIPVIKIGNISNGGDVILNDNTQYVTDDFWTINEKYHIKKGDILISLTGSHINQPNSMVGRTCRSYSDKKYLLNQRAGKIIPKSNVDSNYMYYLFSSKAIKENIVARAYGAANQVNVSPTAIGNIKWDFPEKIQQEKMGDFLRLFDELIQNNIKRMKLLEQVAENLYKEWFVRFRFPGYENSDFENGIPKDWKIIRLGEVIKVSTGKCNRQDAEETGEYPLFDRSQEIKKSSTWIKDCEAIIVPGEGTRFVPRYYVGKFNLHQRCYCVEPIIEGTGKFLFYMLKMNRYYFLSVATGATVPSLRQNNFTLMKFVMPALDICKKYNDIVTEIFDMIENLQKKNANLIEQRDLLLPRLMSGKLEVK